MTTYNYSSSEFKPKEGDGPKDTVSALLWDRFKPNENTLFSASWDGYVRMYAVPSNPY